MLVKFTVEVDGRVVGTAERDVSGTAAEIEEGVRELQQRTGRIVLESAFQRIADQTPAPCCCGHKMKNCGRRVIGVQAMFGEIPVERRRYRCPRCGHEAYPADARYCCGQHRLTRPLAQRICQLATVEHFTRLPELVAAQHGVNLCHETMWDLVHEVGTAVDKRRQAEAQPSVQRRIAPPAEQRPPKTIYVTCDGIMYCTNLTEPRHDDPELQRLTWQQMKVGCVYWQDAQERWHKQITWGRESPAEFGAALWRLACQCGYQQAPEKIFAADGGEWCWEIHARYFGEATGILDWYHASEHVWDAARQVAPDASSVWAQAALDHLHEGGGAALVTWLKSQPAPSADGARAALEHLINYSATKVDLMNYPDDRRHGWQIGTGMIESTCKQLVGCRLKGPGMHWSEAGALAVTALRATDLNGKWNPCWNTLYLSA
jgi:DNA-directed RNA polymerase subunit RPC12/RpoP